MSLKDHTSSQQATSHSPDLPSLGKNTHRWQGSLRTPSAQLSLTVRGPSMKRGPAKVCGKVSHPQERGEITATLSRLLPARCSTPQTSELSRRQRERFRLQPDCLDGNPGSAASRW